MIKALGQLVAPQLIRLARHRDAFDKFAWLTILFAVVQEKVFQRQASTCVTFSQMQGGAKSNERGRAIPDGRSVRDVTADGGRVAHLNRAVAPDHLGKGWVQTGHFGLQLGQSGHSTDADFAICYLNTAQICAAVQKSGRAEVAEILCDPQAHIRSSRNQGRVGVVKIPCGQFVRGCRLNRLAYIPGAFIKD